MHEIHGPILIYPRAKVAVLHFSCALAVVLFCSWTVLLLHFYRRLGLYVLSTRFEAADDVRLLPAIDVYGFEYVI